MVINGLYPHKGKYTYIFMTAVHDKCQTNQDIKSTTYQRLHRLVQVIEQFTGLVETRMELSSKNLI